MPYLITLIHVGFILLLRGFTFLRNLLHQGQIKYVFNDYLTTIVTTDLNLSPNH